METGGNEAAVAGEKLSKREEGGCQREGEAAGNSRLEKKGRKDRRDILVGLKGLG